MWGLAEEARKSVITVHSDFECTVKGHLIQPGLRGVWERFSGEVLNCKGPRCIRQV